MSTPDEGGATPLMSACCHAKVGLVEVILGAPGVDVNRTDALGRTALFFASEYGALDIVKALLATPGIDVNLTENGTTPLVVALAFGRAEVADVLRAAGAEPRYTLRSASFQGNADEVGRILDGPDAGDVNEADASGRTALWWAAWANQAPALLRLLAAPGIDVNREDNAGNTPLAWAVRKGHLEVIELLKNAGAVK